MFYSKLCYNYPVAVISCRLMLANFDLKRPIRSIRTTFITLRRFFENFCMLIKIVITLIV